ncbi:hypothetical protein [Nocardia sp. CA-119907]|uniref:hypothetical protein n=1 Tax=Nocardia sp. CA-119907 TaxID=3239973 RepID=UPI003D954F5D
MLTPREIGAGQIAEQVVGRFGSFGGDQVPHVFLRLLDGGDALFEGHVRIAQLGDQVGHQVLEPIPIGSGHTE